MVWHRHSCLWRRAVARATVVAALGQPQGLPLRDLGRRGTSGAVLSSSASGGVVGVVTESLGPPELGVSRGRRQGKSGSASTSVDGPTTGVRGRSCRLSFL